MNKVKKQLKQISKMACFCLIFSLGAIIFSMGINVVFAEWRAAGSNPPDDNVYTPLDVSSGNQVKKGYLLIDPNYNPYGDMPLVNYPLEVKGAGEISDKLIIANNLEVDSGTLFVNSSNHFVGIGTMTPATKLNIEGGTLKINATGANALEGYSSTDTGIYGVSSAAGYAGVYGESTGAYGVYGINLTNGIGVLGFSYTGTGVKGVSGSNTNGAIYGQSAGLLSWAGYFAGRLQATSEVVGTKFLPTKLQNSLVPYTSGWKVGEITAGSNPKNLVFDGTYIWTANSGATTVSKVQPSTGKEVLVVDLGVGSTPLDITFDGRNIWTSSSNGHLFKINPVNGNIDKDYDYSATGNIYNLTFSYEGNDVYVWGSFRDNNVVKKIRGSDGIVGCSAAISLITPEGLAFDGEYVWVASKGNSQIIKLDSNCGEVWVINEPEISNPENIIFDGTYLWVTNNTASGTNNLVKINPLDDPSDGIVIPTYSTNITNAYDLAFDGTYLWITHDNTKVVRMRAFDGVVEKSFDADSVKKGRGIIFDKTYIWIGFDSGTTISKYYSGTGWGHTDLASVLNLQSSTPGYAQSGSFSVSGTGVLGGKLTVGADIDALNNVWDGSYDRQRAFSYGCDEGEFVKGIVTGSSLTQKKYWGDEGVKVPRDDVTNDTSPAPLIIPDDKKGAIIVWREWDDFNDSERRLLIQRLNADGERLWDNDPGPGEDFDGIPMATEHTNAEYDIVSDGSSGAVVVWNDYAREIQIQRINNKGERLWGNSGKLVLQDANPIFTNPRIVAVGQGYYIIVWNDNRNGNRDIYAQKIDSNGNIQWLANGVPVETDPKDQGSFQLISDGLDGAFIAWPDLRNDDDGACNCGGDDNCELANGDDCNMDIYVTRLKGDGTIYAGFPKQVTQSAASNGNGFPVNLLPQKDHNLALSYDGSGNQDGIVLSWHQCNENTWAYNCIFTTESFPWFTDIFVEKINNSGNSEPLWGGTAKRLTNQISGGYGGVNPRIINSIKEGVIIVFSRNNCTQKNVRRIKNSDGTEFWSQKLYTDTGSSCSDGDIDITTDDLGGVLVTWGGGWVQRVDKNGNILWEQEFGFNADGFSSSWVQIISDKEEGAIIVGTKEGDYGFPYAQRINKSSNLLCRPL